MEVGNCVLHLRNHAFDVKVSEEDLDSFTDLTVKEVVALGVAWIKAREVWRPESSIGRCRAIVTKTARHRRNLLACRYAEIYLNK